MLSILTDSSFFCPYQITYIRPFAGQHFVIKTLLPVDIGDALLQLLDRGSQRILLFRQHFLSGQYGGFSRKAQVEILLHFLNTQPALFQTRQVADPFYVLFVKHTAIVPVPLDIGNKPLVAVEFQGLIGHIQLPADLHNSYVEVNGERLGNTQYMAYVIQENTSANIFRILPKTPYPTDHNELLQVAQEEILQNARPEIDGTIENFDSYDTVFAGA